MNILGIIPARYASTRLEGKPLADIHGKPMIQHVYERASQAIKKLIVATDDQRIADAVHEFGGQAVMTSANHTTGTNRCLEAYQAYAFEHDEKIDVVLNIQGDEPMLDPRSIKKLSACFEDEDVQLATLVTAVSDPRDLQDTSVAFVVLSESNNALYFSRSPIPHVRSVELSQWLKHHNFYKHIGMYAYRPKALQSFASMPVSLLERAEMLEQNRWLEAGNQIRVEFTEHQGVSVDTVSDLNRVRKLMS